MNVLGVPACSPDITPYRAPQECFQAPLWLLSCVKQLLTPVTCKHLHKAHYITHFAKKICIWHILPHFLHKVKYLNPILQNATYFAH